MDSIQNGSTQQTSAQTTQMQTLIDISNKAKYFKTPEGELYTSVPVKGHYKVMVVNDKGDFRKWLVKRHYDDTKTLATTASVLQVIELIEANVFENAPVHPLFTRVGYANGNTYLDMANEQGQVIEVDTNGWRVLDDSPVYFRQMKTALSLPEPVRGGNIEQIKAFLNIESEQDWIAIVSFILMMLHPTGPYPLLVLGGNSGSTKSSTTRFIKSIIDPSTAPTKSAPKDERDMMVSVKSNYVMAYENLSHIPEWFSDALCRLSTGSAFATRAMYSDETEHIFSAKRPVIINGISDLVTKGDLLSRSLTVTLPTMPIGAYRTEKSLNDAFELAHPSILGAVLDIVSCALERYEQNTGTKQTRMVEMEAWIAAAEPRLGWATGTYVQTYQENQQSGLDAILEASHVAKAIIDFIGPHNPYWRGNATDLDTELRNKIDFESKQWPSNPKTLSDALKKLASALATVGIIVTHSRSNSKRFIELTYSDAHSKKKSDVVTHENETVTHENMSASLSGDASIPNSDEIVTQVTQSDAKTIPHYLLFSKNNKKEAPEDEETKENMFVAETASLCVTASLSDRKDNPLPEHPTPRQQYFKDNHTLEFLKDIHWDMLK